MVQVIAGRYELVELLGRGGMGAVWRARDRTLGREVAIKEVSLPRGLDDAQVERIYARTFREARSAARFDHPGIVTVYDVVEEDGRPWIVMRLVRAEALDKVIAREGPLPPARVAAIGLDVLDALIAAHSAGVVHRDVKPGNVLLPEGRAVLTDFGIATVAGDETLTQSGAIVGSPAYLAPERARHQKATPASDLWSLGATLYAAVEGRPPYDRPDMWGVMAALLADEPDPMERAGPLEPVLRGLLQKDPDLRMRPEEAERLLRRVAQGTPSPVRETPGSVPADVPGARDVTPPKAHGSPTRPQSDPAPRRRHPWPMILILGIANVAVLAALLTFMYTDSRNENRTDGRGSSASASPAVSTSENRPAPEGYRLYRGSVFTAYVPKGWNEESAGDDVTFTDPTEGSRRGVALQRIDSPFTGTDTGDALAAAAQDMKNDGNYPGFRQESFRRDIPFLGDRAAELQFTFTKDGVPGRARVRFFRLAGAYYQAILVAPQNHWDETVPHYETFLKSLRAAS